MKFPRLCKSALLDRWVFPATRSVMALNTLPLFPAISILMMILIILSVLSLSLCRARARKLSGPRASCESSGFDSWVNVQVLVERKASSRTAILNRPSSLNAINISMVSRLQKLYTNWEGDPSVAFVALKGEGRAFSAGGDIVALYNLIKEGNLEECKQLFWTVYSFIYFLGTYTKPHVALLDGITMGGGAGISIPSTFRVATDKTIFATPETLIGFHPDAGASFYLSRLPGYMGSYFKLPLVEEQLGRLATDDLSIINNSLGGYVVHPGQTSVIHRTKVVDKCFSHDTVEEIIDCLEMEAAETKDSWCISTLKKLKEAAPLSLKVSLRSGVRAKVVDKDFTPKWDLPSLEHVTPLSALEPQLQLPTNHRVPKY